MPTQILGYQGKASSPTHLRMPHGFQTLFLRTWFKYCWNKNVSLSREKKNNNVEVFFGNNLNPKWGNIGDKLGTTDKTRPLIPVQVLQGVVGSFVCFTSPSSDCFSHWKGAELKNLYSSFLFQDSIKEIWM